MDATTIRVPVYQAIARALDATQRCHETHNARWEAGHRARAERIVREHLPSGSGIDCGTKLDDRSTPDRLCFVVEYHGMNDAGMYVGWTTYTVWVKASLAFGIAIRVTGGDRDMRDYLAELYQYALTRFIQEYPTAHADTATDEAKA